MNQSCVNAPAYTGQWLRWSQRDACVGESNVSLVATSSGPPNPSNYRAEASAYILGLQNYSPFLLEDHIFVEFIKMAAISSATHLPAENDHLKNQDPKEGEQEISDKKDTKAVEGRQGVGRIDQVYGFTPLAISDTNN